MPTTLTTPKTNEPAMGGGTNLPPIDPEEWGGDDGGGGRDPLPELAPPPEGYRIALWLTLISVAMLFLSLASAYIFLRVDTQPIVTPSAFWPSTAAILGSSATLELARRGLRQRDEDRFKRWMRATMLLGGIFLLSQLVAWRQLVDAGFYVNRNLHVGLAYIFTGLHAAHLLGGIGALIYVMLKPVRRWTSIRRRVSVDMTALYWHFIGGIWVLLLALVFLWK
ncbi:MAG: cytochrome c oxidase subunit 3 [Blastocatellia bacterium]|nr:cytochrome c oxidase subunit 3 [Blastocatellia bacterium]